MKENVFGMRAGGWWLDLELILPESYTGWKYARIRVSNIYFGALSPIYHTIDYWYIFIKIVCISVFSKSLVSKQTYGPFVYEMMLVLSTVMFGTSQRRVCSPLATFSYLSFFLFLITTSKKKINLRPRIVYFFVSHWNIVISKFIVSW